MLKKTLKKKKKRPMFASGPQRIQPGVCSVIKFKRARRATAHLLR